MWLGVALRGAHLRLPWLRVAWSRLVSLHICSPLGSQNSLAPLMFDDAVASGQGAQVARTGDEDVITVGSQAHHLGIDHIGVAAAGQQHPGPPALAVIDRHNISASQPGQRRQPTQCRRARPESPLPRWSPAPARQPLSLDLGHQVTITTLHGHERPGLQHQYHAVPRPRRSQPDQRRLTVCLASISTEPSC